MIIKLQKKPIFKVAPDKAHPFIVKTGNLQTEVLGTEFNLRNYCATDAHVTLVHGAYKYVITIINP
ncbi:FecR domain-containing protein [Bacteroides ihuae]|uniref:FecR domain-containing protein n=1 Tax=Bacteroides ihuae TaxID=1852362 RepID=UPI0008D96816|nr:FecR domain-containing protein [Bacteroides ihuae]